jgi:hypothetical protein
MDKFILDNKVFEINDALSWRDVGEDLVALNTTSGEYFTFSNTGRIVWLSIAEGATLDRLTEKITSEYNVDENQALSDIKSFINELKESGLIQAF